MRLRPVDELGDLLGRHEREVAGGVEHLDVAVVLPGVAPVRTGPGEQPAIGLPGVLVEVAELTDHVERLAELTLDLVLAEHRLEALGVADHPDLRDLGHPLQRGHHVGHQGPAADLEIDLAVAVDRPGGAAIPGRNDRGDPRGRLFRSTRHRRSALAPRIVRLRPRGRVSGRIESAEGS
jgi:hypothetical protein